MILLDTCALLWLAHDQIKLSNEALNLINDATVVYISAVTGFEIGIKYWSGKLELPVPPGEWTEKICAHHDISVIDIDLTISIKSTQLPPVHKDPCDRFIIATALVHGFPVVTADDRFEAYGVRIVC